jgi:FKBP-type peptidyl-prolyl cis-trans isomerase FklB
MKKSSIIICTLLFVMVAAAQQKKAPVKKTAAPGGTAAPIKTSADSLSYAIGMSLASFYKQQGITNINTTLVNRAINDVMKTGKPCLTEEQMGTCINTYLSTKRMEKSATERNANAGIIEANHKVGNAFLAENKAKAGVVTTASGLQYEILKQGDGPKPTINDKVKCHYTGVLINGKKFDSSVDRGEPAEFPVGGVIAGWTEALQLMTVGSKWKLYLPANLAYGDSQAGPDITPGSTLIFEVELLEIVK